MVFTGDLVPVSIGLVTPGVGDMELEKNVSEFWSFTIDWKSTYRNGVEKSCLYQA